MASNAQRKYFGTDGIRGRVGEHPITPDFVLRLGMAAGSLLAERSAEPTVLIGKDTRVSGYIFEAALEAGFASAGVNVLMAGPMPTPAVAYLAKTLRLSAGVVISASHNPFEDNGIKFFDGHGEKLPDAMELEIEQRMEQPLRCAAPDRLGKARRLNDAGGRYIEFCKRAFPAQLSLQRLRLVVDCAHGAAYQVAPQVFHELGAEVIAMGDTPDGFNINQGVGATHPEALAAAVVEQGADCGLALDGDGDRLIMVGADGRIFSGDELLYAMVRQRVMAQGRQSLEGVVGTAMSNLALEKALERMGLDFRRAKVGDRYVLEMLKETGWRLGGESSGHLLNLDLHTTGDGIVSALQVLAAMVASGQRLEELLGDLQLFPQVMINVPLTPSLRDGWRDHSGLAAALQAAEAQLAGRGRVLIRASGTEPLLRVMVETACRDEASALAQQLAASLN